MPISSKEIRTGPALAAFAACLAVLMCSQFLASLVQRDFGRVDVRNVVFYNGSGVRVRAKLFRPVEATANSPMPGVVAMHGYQNNRESSDPVCIELARRGCVVLNVDAIGRGNSGLPGQEDDPGFDRTFGGRAALRCIRDLSFVDTGAIGLVGHSLGAEMLYRTALADSSVNALVITGFGWTTQATQSMPRNMLMIFSRRDEFRERMTGTRDFAREWMHAPQTRAVIEADNPQFETTYGRFADGTARRAYMPSTVHVLETHANGCIAETLEWYRQALKPPPHAWKPSADQIWHVKEWATLAAMLACFISLLPLSCLFLRTRLFSPIVAPVHAGLVCDLRAFLRRSAVNGLLMWLYLPLVAVLFGIHAYVVPVDRVFPQMVTNGVVWWFVCINAIGLLLFRRWYHRVAASQGVSLNDLGLSFDSDRFRLDWGALARTALLAVLLWGFAYLLEYGLEQALIVDFRFVFPYANDLTPYRFLLMLLYLPFLLFGFLATGCFLFGQLRLRMHETLPGTCVRWSAAYTAVLVVPLVLLLAAQYVPLFIAGVVPFVGPGGMFVLMLITLCHTTGVLLMMVPLFTWMYLVTGRPYLGALLCALIVAWMFTSSQVIAPVPVTVR